MERIDKLVARKIDELEDGDTFVVVDWRDEEDGVVQALSEHLSEADAMEPELRGDELWVHWHGSAHKLPLSMSPHDRYIAISSVAALVQPRYRFWLSKRCLGDDTHLILVLNADESAYLESAHAAWAAEHLQKLELGYDYFNDLRVPYLGNENHNPDFEREREALREAREKALPELTQMIQQAFHEAGFKPGFGLEAAIKAARTPWWKVW